MSWLLRLLASAAVAVAFVLVPGAAHAYPPEPPSEEEARAQLAALTVVAEGSMDGYDREDFPHWSSQGDGCDTREVVLQRDGTNVSVDGDCYPTSGRWYSVYDAQWVEDPSEVHIDHIVPLAEAWRSGADEWTESAREQFANDLTHPQLIAVSGESNMTKGDSDPAAWRPPNESTWCVYSREWINVKYVWELTINEAERTALLTMLSRC